MVKGNVVKGRVSQIDLLPTLLDLMGEHVPGELQGESRAPVLRGESTLEMNDVFVQMNRGVLPGRRKFVTDIPEEKINRVVELPWRTVVSAEGWKLNLSPGDQCELYDLNTDPYEQENLYDDPAQKDRIRDLASRILAWQERTEDNTSLLVE